MSWGHGLELFQGLKGLGRGLGSLLLEARKLIFNKLRGFLILFPRNLVWSRQTPKP